MAGKRGPRLKSVGDVADFLAKIIRQAHRGELDAGAAAKLGYLLNILRSCIEAADLEERIEALEAQLQHSNELRAVG